MKQVELKNYEFELRAMPKLTALGAFFNLLGFHETDLNQRFLME